VTRTPHHPGERDPQAYHFLQYPRSENRTGAQDRYRRHLPARRLVEQVLVEQISFDPWGLRNGPQAALQDARGPLNTKTFTRVEADDFLLSGESSRYGLRVRGRFDFFLGSKV
jgi:hypothetical protein